MDTAFKTTSLNDNPDDLMSIEDMHKVMDNIVRRQQAKKKTTKQVRFGVKIKHAPHAISSTQTSPV